jgi:hypothetical protein
VDIAGATPEHLTMTVRASDGLDTPNCERCLFPMIAVVASWWCPTCKVRVAPGDVAAS